MLQSLKRHIRKFFPRRDHPVMDNFPLLPRDRELGELYLASLSQMERSGPAAEFVRARYFEACRWRAVLLHALNAPNPRILDVGAGNGAFELSTHAVDAPAFGVDILWAHTLRKALNERGLGNRRSHALVEQLPYAANTFDGVVCLETIEHLRNARSAAREIVRVLRPGGFLLLTTPSRLRYLFSPDPHFGITGLLLLPPTLQRAVAAHYGATEPHHFVDRIYSSVSQIRRLFEDLIVVEVISRSRAPREFFWDAVLFSKHLDPSSATSRPA